MVEGHGVRRVANRHDKQFKGKRFKAVSPNGRFTDGAEAIDGKILYRIEAIGKNLFHFHSDNADGAGEVVVVHIHFGMSGRFTTFPAEPAEEIPGTCGDILCPPLPSNSPPLLLARTKKYDPPCALQRRDRFTAFCTDSPTR